MNAILQAAAELQGYFVENRHRFCFIGGLAVLRWGKPRATQDVDASLLVERTHEAQVIAQLLNRFSPRVTDAEKFALENRVILASASNGVALDIALAEFDFEKEIIARATPFEFASGVTLHTVSADDLVVLKAFAGRDQDWLDVQGIVAAQPLNRNWILEQLGLLTASISERDPRPRLSKLFRQYSQ